MLTKQEIFDGTARHLLTQNAKSAQLRPDIAPEKPFCMYRGPGNTKCAVGYWIPDNLYVDDMEGNVYHGLFEKYPDVMREIGFDRKEHGRLLNHLQDVHDGYEPSEWPFRLGLIARDFDLDESVLA